MIDIEDEENINKLFIIVDKDFLVNMDINYEQNKNKKISINVKKEGLEIKLKSEEEYTENIIKIEEVKKGIYKFGEKEDEILLDGDQTRFIGEQFSDMEQQSILGYISWLKR